MNGIIESLPIVASMLAEQTGIKLTISGEAAFTNGEIINLPLLPSSGEKIATLAYGYLCHEAAHVRYTDMDAMTELDTPIERRMLNILEDARIEHRLMRDFPGAKLRLENLSKEIEGEVHSSDQHASIGAPTLFTNHLLNHMLVTALGRHWVEADWEQSRKAFASTFGEPALIKLESITVGMHLKPSSLDLIPVVKSLMLALKDAQQEAQQQAEEARQNQQSQQNQQPSPPQQGQGNGDDADDDGTAAGGDGSDQNPGQDAQASGLSDQNDAPSDPQNNQGTDGDFGSMADAAGASTAQDFQAIADALAQLLQAGEGDFGNDRQDAVKAALESQAVQSGQPRIGMMQCVPADADQGNGYVSTQEVADSTRALRNRIRALLQSEVKTRHRYADQGSRLAGSRLARLECGKTDVFRHTTTRKGVDTAISLLVDQSGSMADPAGNGKKLCQVACEAAYTIAESVEGVKGVTMAVNAFPFYHAQGYDTAEIKAFGEPLQKSLRSFGSIRPQGGTPLAEAMMAVGFRLYRRPEHRKILILATDGDPDDDEATFEAVRQLSRLGVELVAIGINTGAVRRFFSDHLIIHHVQELPQELFGVLKRLLFSNHR